MLDRDLAAFVKAACDGHDVIDDDAFVRVENPRYEPHNGEPPYITVKAHTAVRALTALIVDLAAQDPALSREGGNQ